MTSNNAPLARAIVAGLLATFALSAAALPPGTPDEIRKRIAPIGELNVAESSGEVAEAAPAEPRSGQEVYDSYCSTCHASGVSGAPVLGNQSDWEPRIAKGIDVLYESTLNGLNVMPPRGTCPDCSDEELQVTVDYMVSAAE